MTHDPSSEARPDLSPPSRVTAYGPFREGALDEAIEERAYQAFRDRGRVHGHDQEDWDAATWLVISETLG